MKIEISCKEYGVLRIANVVDGKFYAYGRTYTLDQFDDAVKDAARFNQFIQIAKRPLNEIINKFNVGDHITDTECDELFKFFKNMESGCKALGGDYNLFRNKMRENAARVAGYINARLRKN